MAQVVLESDNPFDLASLTVVISLLFTEQGQSTRFVNLDI